MFNLPLRARVFLGAALLTTAVYLTLHEPAMSITYDLLGFAAALALYAGARSLPVERRLPWYLLTAGMVAWVAGDTIWSVYDWVGEEAPFPSIADALYLLAYPLWILGLMKLSRRGGRRDWIVLVDAMIVVVSAGLVAWLYLIRGQVEGLHSFWEIAISAAYPLVDILLLGVLVRMLLSSRRWEGVHRLLLLGLVATLASDVAYAVALLGDGYSAGVIDLGWLAFYTFWGTAGLAVSSTTDEAQSPARRLPPWLRMVPISIAVLIMPVLSWIQAARGEPSNIALSVAAIPLVLLVAVRFGIMLARTQQVADDLDTKSTALQRALDDLHMVQAERARLLDRTVRATEEERARVAVELHDGPIQQFTVLGFRLGKARSRLRARDVDGTDQALALVEEELSRGIAELRRLMSDLRPPALDEGGLEAALRDQVELFGHRTGVQISFESDARGEPDPDTQVVLYRITQEALTNVTRHASARRVHVRLSTPNSHATLEIRDDGVGFDESRAAVSSQDGHFGLAGMAQRAAMVGGRFEVHSRPGAGTEIQVEVPLKAAS
jgi:signal transduction histidine kinase